MNAPTGRILKSSEWFVGHVAAIVVGLVLMFSGVGMGVTIVLLPIGVPVGLVGLALFLWGMVLYTRRGRTEAPVDRGEPEVTEDAKRAMLP